MNICWFRYYDCMFPSLSIDGYFLVQCKDVIMPFTFVNCTWNLCISDSNWQLKYQRFSCLVFLKTDDGWQQLLHTSIISSMRECQPWHQVKHLVYWQSKVVFVQWTFCIATTQAYFETIITPWYGRWHNTEKSMNKTCLTQSLQKYSVDS